ncbi:hypothetical protein ACFL08_04435 [Patescibacteria group bacterium]
MKDIDRNLKEEFEVLARSIIYDIVKDDDIDNVLTYEDLEDLRVSEYFSELSSATKSSVLEIALEKEDVSMEGVHTSEIVKRMKRVLRDTPSTSKRSLAEKFGGQFDIGYNKMYELACMAIKSFSGYKV